MAFLSKKQEYKPLAQNDEHCAPRNFEKHIKAKNRLLWTLIIAVVLNLLLISIIALQTLKPRVVSKDLSYLSSLSLDLVRTQMNGTLFPPIQQSGSRLPPGADADAYWEFFQPTRLMPLTREDLVKLGKDPEVSVQFPQGWGVTAGTYLGSLDVFHKLHCLSELRGAAFRSYPLEDHIEKPEKRRSTLYWIHLRHCIDMLAQEIQCNANLDIITFEWMDTQYAPFPDFSIQRMCTDWNQLVDWSEKNTIINKTGLPRIVRPAGTIPAPAEFGYYEMYGFEDSVLYPDGKGYNNQV